MTAVLLAGISLAVCSAVFNNTGMVFEKLAIRKMPVLHARRTGEMLRTLFKAPLWLVGFVLLAAGLCTQVFALTLAPISIVQSVSACGIVLLLMLSHFLLGDRLGRSEYVGMVFIGLSLVLLGLSVQAHADHAHSGASFGTLVVAGGPALVVSLCFFLLAEHVHGSSPERARLRAPLFGLSSGLLYGVAALGVKAVSSIIEQHGLVGGLGRVITSPALYVVVVASAVGFLVFQTALQRCPASILVPVNNVTGSAFFIAIGTMVFHEQLPTAAWPLAFRLAAFACIVVGLCALSMGQDVPDALATRGAEHDEHVERYAQAGPGAVNPAPAVD
jgi:drug/metabolite transporter (DMT)-like permease